jgi:hypothetical protein
VERPFHQTTIPPKKNSDRTIPETYDYPKYCSVSQILYVFSNTVHTLRLCTRAVRTLLVGGPEKTIAHSSFQTSNLTHFQVPSDNRVLTHCLLNRRILSNSFTAMQQSYPANTINVARLIFGNYNAAQLTPSAFV